MILDWPDTLPRPERNSWSLELQDGRRRRQGDAGPPGFERRFSSVATLVTLSMLLDRGQKAVFDLFYRDDCAWGSRLFRMADPTTHGWPLYTTEGVPLLTAEGTPILAAKVWLCAWGDKVPVETLKGGEFRKTFSLVVMP
ncbi:hypothetical protein [Chachezhania antarctica]|uniref:hypothetical protein n=1 Tax=Chachezhania antarctica TaxID=2340860 RepID=UPI000EB3F0CB|nr:hypothetical protein [Chachezhania antarctica]|tara:strand:- start:14059 stop:14478 length:420 start_codon:yes stop_codon:yes gene_type:complete